MNIFVYSDESGVFDKVHNDIFVFGGIVFLSKDDRDIMSRKYSAAERIIRSSSKIPTSKELKAATITNSQKGKLYRSLNGCYKFAAIVEQKRVHDHIFVDKKTKQRYLDYVYKIAVKRLLEKLIQNSVFNPSAVENMYFFVDEHTTATNGCYELREGLEQEFRSGTFNWSYNTFYQPLFPQVKCVELKFCNSQSNTLVRAADIVANKVYYRAVTNDSFQNGENKLYVTYSP